MRQLATSFNNQAGITLIEVIMGTFLLAILAPGLMLVLEKGMDIFFFERGELWVQKDITQVMDRMTDQLREASSIDSVTITDIVFNNSSKRYYWDSITQNIYDINNNQLNSIELKVTDLSFVYDSGLKLVQIAMKFQKGSNPVLELQSQVAVRNLL